MNLNPEQARDFLARLINILDRAKADIRPAKTYLDYLYSVDPATDITVPDELLNSIVEGIRNRVNVLPYLGYPVTAVETWNTDNNRFDFDNTSALIEKSLQDVLNLYPGLEAFGYDSLVCLWSGNGEHARQMVRIHLRPTEQGVQE